MSTTTTAATGFDTYPNRRDVRIVCRTCGESKSGSLARAWAHSHSHAPEFTPGTPVVVRPHGMTITDAVITGTRPYDTPAGFVYEYRRESNGAEGIILPALTHRRIS